MPDPVVSPQKPFYKTSEFYGIVGSAGLVFLDELATGTVNRASLTTAGLAAAYALARGLAKLGMPKP